MLYSGALMMVVSVLLTWHLTIWRQVPSKRVIPVSIFTATLGFAITLQDRVTELHLKGVGTIKAATERATTDANAISDLRRRVESQSATVDLVAAEASKAKELSEEVAQANKNAEEKVAELDATLKKANTALNMVQVATTFSIIVLSAQNDDRNAFDVLRQISENKNDQYAALAERAWMKIMDSHSNSLYQSGFYYPWRKDIDPSKLSFEELRREFNADPSWLKVPMLEYIQNRQDIREIDKLSFFADVLKSDTSLMAVEYAGRYFTQQTHQNIKPLAVDYLLKWWADHQAEYRDK